MFNESLNRFKFDSTRVQQAFNIFTLSTIFSDLFKPPKHLIQQSVEHMLNQMWKPFKRAFTFPRALAVPREAPLATRWAPVVEEMFFCLFVCLFVCFCFV